MPTFSPESKWKYWMIQERIYDQPFAHTLRQSPSTLTEAVGKR